MGYDRCVEVPDREFKIIMMDKGRDLRENVERVGSESRGMQLTTGI